MRCPCRSNPLGEVSPRRDTDQCSDYQAFGYYCVPHYTCRYSHPRTHIARSEANFTINTSGSGLFDVRGLEDEETVPDRKDVLRTKCEDADKVSRD